MVRSVLLRRLQLIRNPDMIDLMAQAAQPAPTGNYYHEFLAEREEILKHKWLESERAGADVGFEQALTEWAHKHRSSWREERNTPGVSAGN